MSCLYLDISPSGRPLHLSKWFPFAFLLATRSVALHASRTWNNVLELYCFEEPAEILAIFRKVFSSVCRLHLLQELVDERIR